MKFSKEIIKYKQNFLNNKYLKEFYNEMYISCIKYKFLKNFIKYINKIDNEYLFDDCPICLSSLENNYITTVCNHKYHPSCLINVFDLTSNGFCCLCRCNIANRYINDNMKRIIQFVAMIKLNINNINNTYAKINKAINITMLSNNIKHIDLQKNIISSCCFFNYINRNKIIIIDKIIEYKNIIEDFKYYNYHGVRKILKKFKKHINIDADVLLNELDFVVI